jgi:hypothetical protein
MNWIGLGLLLVLPAHADESSIKVGEILGEQISVKVSPNHSKSAAGKRAVYWGDQIETPAHGTALLVLFPKFVLTLGPSSKLKVIGNLIWKKDSAVLSEGSVSLLKGSLHAKLDHPEGTKQSIKILAPRSISSIRGTELYVSVDKSDSKVFVKEGTVVVTDLHGQKESSLTAGTGQWIKGGGNPEVLSSGDAIESNTLAIQSDGVDQDWKSSENSLLAAQNKNFEELRSKYDGEFEKAVGDIEKEASQTTKEMQSEFDDFMKE